ncbi:MAG: HAD-IIA family hydrolase [Bacteroidales bacterium]|nr:HAD-IIA family hydrolase [Bacteroidales bacterium]
MSMQQRISRIRHIVMDMDGTIYLGSKVFPFTLPFLEMLKKKGIGYSFLTNNPTRSPQDYLRKLSGMGIPCTPEQMLTTSQAAVEYVQMHMPGVKRVYVLGTASLQELFRSHGFVVTDENDSAAPDLLVVSFDTTLVYPRLCKAAWWASHGVPYLATNPDRVCPTEEQTVLVDCGSIQKCIEHATGRRADVVLGKPDPTMLFDLEARLGLQKDEVAMIGDRVYTDIAMARNAGALPVLVLSGETTPELAARACEEGDLVVNDLSEFGKMIEDYKL